MVTPKQINQWLAEHGLGQYIDSFKANDIDLKALPFLNEEDLTTLGVSLGHRRILINEIKQLNQATVQPTQLAEHSNSEETAERRQLTVMFCDLVGSTVLAQQIDPEDMREVLRQYQNAVSASVRQYGGYVARFVGDGVLSYFGWPRAYEDQADRAVRASIDIVESMQRFDNPIRIGIDSGLVVVGDLIGEATSDLDTVVGDTPNLAARLQSMAKPGEIIIGTNTRILLGDNFKFKSIAPKKLKGYKNDIPAWKVMGERPIENRFEASHGKKLSNLVGRQHELGLLKERWQLAQDSEGQIVLLCGEAGIGKSRLARDFSIAISRDLRFNLSYQCSPHHTSSAFYPIIARLQRAVCFLKSDTTDDKLDKLEKSLYLWGSNVKRVAPLFAELMSVQGQQRYGALELTPPQLRQRTIEAMIDQILALCSRRPVYILIEDTHWIDHSMMDFISELMPRITDKPVLILITFRPENLHKWPPLPNLTSISLNRLGRKQAAEIANSVGGEELMQAVIEKIVKRADGVPLYIEELTKSVQESFSADHDTATDAIIPPTLQSSLVARLDRLDEAKEIAQIGAVIGREFSQDLLTRVCAKTETQINDALERLLNSGLVFRRGVSPKEIYTFKHSLVQDAAYATILFSKRRRLHALIVDILEEQNRDLTNDKTTLIAHHAFLAERWDKAFEYLQQAGTAAMDSAAVHEAVALFERALIAGSHLPQSGQSLQTDIDLRFDLRNALWSIGEFERILTILKQAQQMADKLDDAPRTGWISVYTSASLWQLGRSAQALAAANDALAISSKTNDLALSVGSRFYLGCATVTSGDCDSAITIFQETCDQLGGEKDYQRCGLPFLPAVIARSWMVWALTERGEFKQAQVLADRALEIAKQVGHPFNIAHVYYDLGYLYYIKGDAKTAVTTLEQAVEIIDEWGLTYLSPFITGFLGYAYTLSGNNSRALPTLEKALTAYNSIGLGLFRSLVNVYMGKALQVDGQLEQAFERTQKALELSRQRGEQGHQAQALHLLGEITLAPDFLNEELAEANFLAAVKIAEELTMRPLLISCYRDLSQLYTARGQSEKAAMFSGKHEHMRKLLESLNASS